MNIIAIIVAALACFIIGFLAHGPIFGKLWMRLANVHPTGKEKLSDMWPQMFWNLVANLVTALVLSNLIALMSPVSTSSGVMLAFWVWLGFVVTSSSLEVIWMKRSYKLWLFECASSLVCLAAMGAILAGWQ